MQSFFRAKSSTSDRCIADAIVTGVDGLPPGHGVVSVMLRRGNNVATTQQVFRQLAKLCDAVHASANVGCCRL